MSKTCPVNGDKPCRCDRNNKVLIEPDARTTMRKLWTDHATYNKFAINAIVDGTADKDAVVDRVMQNTVDIGNDFGQYLGKENGKIFTTLLKQHEELAADTIKKIVNGNNNELNDAISKFMQNGDDVANFLGKLLPQDKESLRKEFIQHVKYVIKVGTLRHEKKFKEEIVQYDAFYNHMMMLSDLIYCATNK